MGQYAGPFPGVTPKCSVLEPTYNNVPATYISAKAM